ncbi:unnamed protein product [Prorocentrum cordatum]|uniref:HECT-type E3 ubiquitin transferase n=1 Tax=Prorocentrum cordatum TaxID=2364126 RepID=A0ABN9X8B8_9DINO|nr:unnamed protein product [Polarella glacialis]
MATDQRPCKVRRKATIAQSYVEAYSGFLSGCHHLDDDDHLGELYDWVQQPRTVQRVEFWGSRSFVHPRVFFLYTTGDSTKDLDGKFWGFEEGDFLLVDTLHLSSSEYIKTILETRCAQKFEDGCRFDEHTLLQLTLRVSSGRTFTVTFDPQSAPTLKRSRTIQAAEGHMIVDYDVFSDPEDLYDKPLQTHFRGYGGGDGCKFRQHGTAFEIGVVQMPIDGDFRRLSSLLLVDDCSVEHVKDARNHFKSGNVAHVLCHIGGHEAAAALMKLVGAGLESLLVECDQWGMSPAFYAITSPYSSTACLEAVLSCAQDAVKWVWTEPRPDGGGFGYGFNLAHLAAHEGKDVCLEVLSRFGGACNIFSARCRFRSWTPAHHAVGVRQGSCSDSDELELLAPLHDSEIPNRLRCLQIPILHESILQYVAPLLQLDTYSSGQSFSNSLGIAQKDARDASSLCVKDCYGFTAAHYATRKEFLDYLLEIGGLAPLYEDMIARPDRLALREGGTKDMPSCWHDVTRILTSSRKYLPLQVRQLWLSAAMKASIPDGDEGLVLVVDWSSPLSGACEALGVDEHSGSLTTARPALLTTVRNAASDAAAGDGLRREWLTRVAARLLEPDHGLFEQDPGRRTLVVNKHSGDIVPDHLAQFALLGRVIGLAFLHGEQIQKLSDLNGVVLSQLLGRDMNSADALAVLDPEKFKNLSLLEGLDGPSVESAHLVFSVSKFSLPEYLAPCGRAGFDEEVELKIGGANVSVTKENVGEYINLAAKYWVTQLCDQSQPQLVAAKAGLGVLLTPHIEAAMNRLFTLTEIQLTLGGLVEITDDIVKDWKQHTIYEGAVSSSHVLALWFWSVVSEFSFADRAKLLAFCTGSPSPPAVGFSRLPGFNGGIAQFTLVGTGSSEEQLPSASTCFAKLKLPAYKSLQTLRSKLTQAIELYEGFAEAAVGHA